MLRRSGTAGSRGSTGGIVSSRKPRTILVSLLLAPIASSFATQCQKRGPDIRVRYRVKFLGTSEMPAQIRYETPTGTRKIDVSELPWESKWFEFDSQAAIAVIVEIPKTDPSGNLQCEVLTDEPGTTVQTSSTRRCKASGTLPFAS